MCIYMYYYYYLLIYIYLNTHSILLDKDHKTGFLYLEQTFLKKALFHYFNFDGQG